MKFSSPSVIVITGASSGIGAALAARYARPGVTLGLLGRDEKRLSHTASLCRTRGAEIVTGIVDVADAPGMEQWLLRFDEAHPVDLLIANAGVSSGSGEGGETAEQVRATFAVNLGGVLNTVLPLAPRMAGRGRGQIALMSSLAGVRGLPSCPAYSASKNAVRAYGEAIRGVLNDSGVGVSVICPGYIATPMTSVNHFPMPFIMTADKAARIIAAGLARNASRIAFPLALYIPLCLVASLPNMLTDWLFAALPKKTGIGKI